MVTLQYGSRTLTLRNPDLGDTNSVEVRRISRRNRGGDLIGFRDRIWPRHEIYQYEFSYLSRTDLLALLEFVQVSLGQDITITDYNGISRTGIIITPSEEFAQGARENFTTRFQFQVQL